ncbi:MULTISPECIES: guanylate kinase [unclassified Ruminococcus]|uniref:guanylate kinase n=1 Tax=unclassified Ruminococcus TaxID=2608920 RepID=UPI00210AD965|nr:MULTISPECIES: guanylate kinase [unclassified Ruminococcus]MCQ4022596.1 guanylate kinase [Ruminococcus sp. zg-924]MCQ4114836.1 guanylate kinase [Ruminococcus sp. zg-921]
MNNKGRAVIISGPSGSGKGTTVGALLEARPDLKLSISATTRSPRPGEQHGVNYFYLTCDEFNNKIKNGEMLEYAMYCDNLYGTPKEYIEQCINSGEDIILEIEVQGGAQVKAKMPDAISIFLIPPNRESLEKRLRGRGTETEEVILARLAQSYEELKYADKYDYVVICGEMNKCVSDILNIIDSEKLKSANMQDYIKENF